MCPPVSRTPGCASSFVLRVQSVSKMGVDPVSDAAEEEPHRVDDEVGDGVPCLVGEAVGVDAVGGGALHGLSSQIGHGWTPALSSSRVPHSQNVPTASSFVAHAAPPSSIRTVGL